MADVHGGGVLFPFNVCAASSILGVGAASMLMSVGVAFIWRVSPLSFIVVAAHSILGESGCYGKKNEKAWISLAASREILGLPINWLVSTFPGGL